MKSLFTAFALFFSNSAFAMPGLTFLECKNIDGIKASVTLSTNTLSISIEGSKELNFQNQSPVDRRAPSRFYVRWGNQKVAEVETSLIFSGLKPGGIKVFNNGTIFLNLTCRATGFQG